MLAIKECWYYFKQQFRCNLMSETWKDLYKYVSIITTFPISVCFPLLRMEVEGWDPNLEEELGISLDELEKWIDEAVEKSEIVQKKKAQLTELKEWVEQKEEQEAKTNVLLIEANKYVAFSQSPIILNHGFSLYTVFIL